MFPGDAVSVLPMSYDTLSCRVNGEGNSLVLSQEGNFGKFGCVVRQMKVSLPDLDSFISSLRSVHLQ